MQQDFVIYFDFDSTLYNTAKFAEDLWSLIAHNAKMSFSKVETQSTNYFFHPHLGGYEYEKHVSSYGLDPHELWQALDTITDNPNYLYSDSIGFMQSLITDGFKPKILTFGEKRFQLAKIRPMLKYLSTDSYLHAIDVIVVGQKKLEHIKTVHMGQRGVLIDDKPDQMLPKGFTEIHLNRDKALDIPIRYGETITVSNLVQARSTINDLVVH